MANPWRSTAVRNPCVDVIVYCETSYWAKQYEGFSLHLTENTILFIYKVESVNDFCGSHRLRLFSRSEKNTMKYKQYRQPTRCINNGLLIIPVSWTCFGQLFCPSSGAQQNIKRMRSGELGSCTSKTVCRLCWYEVISLFGCGEINSEFCPRN